MHAGATTVTTDRRPGEEEFTPPARWVYVCAVLMTVVLVGFMILKFTVFAGM